MQQQLSKKSEILEFIPGPVISGYRVQYISNKRYIRLNEGIFRCTHTEHAILDFLFHRYQQTCTTEELIALFEPVALNHPDLFLRARRRLTKILSDIRPKIGRSGLLIFAEYNVGYRLDRLSGPLVEVSHEAI